MDDERFLFEFQLNHRLHSRLHPVLNPRSHSSVPYPEIVDTMISIIN